MAQAIPVDLPPPLSTCPHVMVPPVFDHILGAVITLITDDRVETSHWTASAALRNPTWPEQTPNLLRGVSRTNSMVLLFDRSFLGRLLRGGSIIQ